MQRLDHRLKLSDQSVFEPQSKAVIFRNINVSYRLAATAEPLLVDVGTGDISSFEERISPLILVEMIKRSS